MAKASKGVQAGPSKISPLEAIPKLEAGCVASPFNPNPLLPLLSFSRHSDAEVVHKAIWALHRVFVRYINDERVGGIVDTGAKEREGDDEAVEKEGNVKGWVRDRLLDYLKVLGSLLRDSEPALRESGLKLLFALLGPLSVSLPSDRPVIHTPYFRLVLRSLFSPSPSLRGAKSAAADGTGKWIIDESVQVEDDEGVLPSDVVEMVDEEYWAKYDDIRWAFFKESTHLLTNESGLFIESENLLGQLLPLTNLPRQQEDINAFYIPSFSSAPSSTSSAPTKKKAKTGGGKKKKADQAIDALPDWMATYESESEDDESEVGGKKRQRTTALSVHASIHSIPSHLTVYTSLWEAVLSRLRLDDAQTRRVLIGLHGEKGILRHMRADKRVRVADWLGSLVDAGGAKAMLAMNGLFVLMTKYNLDYPDFYRRLYGLLDADVLHVKYRARFFRLLDTFLASPLLPAAMIASFIKRLSRLSLTAPPAGIIITIPFIYNLFKRHPGCMIMIQRHSSDQADEIDPFNAEEPSPLTTGAIGSSCWELASLQKHHLASVSTMAKVYNEVFTKAEYNMEDFLDHGYDTLFATEVNRKIKNPPALNLALESGDGVDPFPHVLGEDQEGDEVSRLWAF